MALPPMLTILSFFFFFAGVAILVNALFRRTTSAWVFPRSGAPPPLVGRFWPVSVGLLVASAGAMLFILDSP